MVELLWVTSILLANNIEWGYLDKLDLYSKSTINSVVSFYNLILQNELSTQKVSINWLVGMIAFLIIGIAIIYSRRR